MELRTTSDVTVGVGLSIATATDWSAVLLLMSLFSIRTPAGSDVPRTAMPIERLFWSEPLVPVVLAPTIVLPRIVGEPPLSVTATVPAVEVGMPAMPVMVKPESNVACVIPVFATTPSKSVFRICDLCVAMSRAQSHVVGLH